MLPNGKVWLTDPFVQGELAGMDRRMLRAGITVLPTTVASIDVETAEIVLPDHGFDEAIPTGRLAIDRMLFRSIPEMALEGAKELRLARLVVRHLGTDLDETLKHIEQLVAVLGDRLELVDEREAIEDEIGQISRRPR